MSKVKKEETNFEGIWKKYPTHKDVETINKMMKDAFEKGKKVLYNYYFKEYKNQVIMERKEFERLRRLDNGK